MQQRKYRRASQYPVVLVLPDRSVVRLPSTVVDTLSLLAWIKEAALDKPGKFTVAFQVSPKQGETLRKKTSVMLLRDAVTYYGEERWGVSRIPAKSPLDDVTFTSGDLRIFFWHIVSKVPSGVTGMLVGPADDSAPDYNTTEGFSVSFEAADGSIPAILDIRWGVTDGKVGVLWDIPYFAGESFTEGNIAVPTLSEALAVIEGIRMRLKVPIRLYSADFLEY